MRRPGLPLAVLVGGLLLVTVAAASLSQLEVGQAGQWQPVLPQPEDAGEEEFSPALDESQEPAPEFSPVLARIAGGVVLAVLLVVAIAVVVGVLRATQRPGPRRRRLRELPAPAPAPAPTDLDEQQVVAAVDAGLDELAGGADPRAAVIGCWLRLQEVAAAAGVARMPADTPAELVLRLLRSHQVSEPVLIELAGLYRQARFAPHEVDDAMRAQAVAALRQLRQSLATARPGGLA